LAKEIGGDVKSIIKPDWDGALAIATVTAAMKSLLVNGLVAFGNVKISLQQPDKIAVGENEEGQVNLFLYRVAPHTRLTGGNRAMGNSGKLALELHYILTASSAQDFQTEILLGRSIQLFHEKPLLTAEDLQRAFKEVPSNHPKRGGKPAPDHLEEIRITPQFLSFEDMARLWSALQARYRPSVAYQASAVLLNSD